jgi:hypothetical protein
MTFTSWFWMITGTLTLGIVGTLLYFLRQAAIEAEANERVLRAESGCASQVQRAAELVTAKGSEKGVRNRVTASASHYSQQQQKCFIEVTVYEHMPSTALVKTLLDSSDGSAVLWSVSGRREEPGRACFGADSMPLDCIEADRRWKAFMSK